MYDFGDGPVPAHKHKNGGGWVADTASVDESVWVYGSAQVYGSAWVRDNAQVSGDARVYGVGRSDGYTFCAVPDKDGVVRVIAGCRYYTFEEAREHWAKTRIGTPLGDETFAILDYLERMVELRGYA